MITKKQLHQSNIELSSELYALKNNVHNLTTYQDPVNPYGMYGPGGVSPYASMFGYVSPSQLNAQQIIDRFNELYAYLGVDRVQETDKTHLIKKKQS